MTDDTINSARIQQDLDATRSRLGSHLSELQDRLSPGQVLDDLMGYFRGSEGAAFGRNLIENVRGNPMPAALTGIGLAWLMASSPRQAGSDPVAAVDTRLHHYGREDYDATVARLQRAEQTVERHPSETNDAHSVRLDTARGQAIGLARHADETTQSFGARIRDALESARGAVTRTTHDVRGQIADALETAGGAVGLATTSAQSAARGAYDKAGGLLSSGGQTGGQLIDSIVESPVLLGALGLAAGALLGALLPKSEHEEAALAGIAGQVRQTASGLAQEGVDRGRTVAEAVMDTTRDSIQGHGLAQGKSAGQLVDAALSGDLAGQAKSVLKDVLETGDAAIRKEVSTSGTS